MSEKIKTLEQLRAKLTQLTILKELDQKLTKEIDIIENAFRVSELKGLLIFTKELKQRHHQASY